MADRYHHTQRGPAALLCSAIAVAVLIASPLMPTLALRIVFWVSSAVAFVLGWSLARLTVEDEGDQLALRFGPFPLFQKRIRYDDILEVEKGRTTFWDGWGIHGNVWNVWGFDCVALRLERGTLRIGTDDADELVAFLKSRIASSG